MKYERVYKSNGDVNFKPYIRHVVQKKAGCIRNKALLVQNLMYNINKITLNNSLKHKDIDLL